MQIARDTFFKSQILFFLLAAIDGHAKNLSLFIEPKGTYDLAPLYDIISAYPLLETEKLQKQKIKMAMAMAMAMALALIRKINIIIATKYNGVTLYRQQFSKACSWLKENLLIND